MSEEYGEKLQNSFSLVKKDTDSLRKDVSSNKGEIEKLKEKLNKEMEQAMVKLEKQNEDAIKNCVTKSELNKVLANIEKNLNG